MSYKEDTVPGYSHLHWCMRQKIPMPQFCERCSEKPPQDLANKSQLYKPETDDWEYLCRKCHMDGDGRNDKLRESGIARRLPPRTCLGCSKEFYKSNSRTKYCSTDCFATTRRRPEKKCKSCGKMFWSKNIERTFCSPECRSPYYGIPSEPDIETFCIDCGIPTKLGKGSARCPACWEDRCGNYDIPDEMDKLDNLTSS